MAAAQARRRAAGQTKPVCGRAGRADWAGEEFRIGVHQEPGRRGAAKVKIGRASETSAEKNGEEIVVNV